MRFGSIIPNSNYSKAPDSFGLEVLKTHLDQYTHLIFTSKTSVRIFHDLISPKPLFSTIVAVGKSTAEVVKELGLPAPLVPKIETAEGIISLLDTLDLSHAFVLWPHSALSRPVLYNYFEEEKNRFHCPVLYHTLVRIPDTLADLDSF